MKKNYRNNLRQPKIYSAPSEKEKKNFPKIFKIFFLFILILLCLIFVVFVSSIFRIKNVQVFGKIEDDSLKYLETYKNKNIFLLDSDYIENELEQMNPQLKNIDISFGIPNVLRATFTERQPKLIWITDGLEFLIDNDGIVFKENESHIKDLPIVYDNSNLEIKIPSQIASKGFVDFINHLNFISQDYNLEFKNFAVNETTFQLDAITNEGIKIIFDTTRPVSDQLDAYEKVYNDHKDQVKEYVDLRVEGWVYFK